MKNFFLLLLLSNYLIAADYLPSSLDNEIISYTYNENYSIAASLAQQQINKNPNSVKYYYYSINIKILEFNQRLAALDYDKREEGRKKISSEIIEYIETIVDKFDDASFDQENKFYYSAVLGYLARMYGLEGSWWSAFKTGLKSKKLALEINKSDPSFYDVYLLLGMYDYYADRLSGVTGFIAGVLGFSGNRENGLKSLALANQKGKLTFGQSSLMLVEIYGHMEDNEYEAIKYYKSFLEKFPNNTRMLNGYCNELMKIWDYETVGKIISADKSNLVDDYVKARYYHTTGNSDSAAEFAQRAISNEKKTWRGVNNYARYLLVYNYWLKGDKQKVVEKISLLDEQFAKAFDEIRKYPNETKWLHNFSSMVAQNKPLSDIQSELAHQPVLNSSYESQLNLMLGLYYYRMRQPDKSEAYFERCLVSDDHGIKYESFKYLIEIYLQIKIPRDKAVRLCDMIKSFENERLNFRCRDMEKKYNL